ncbi:MAG: Re/Si-specific NAD(P)(+) transhydrogenase subunit alpha [Candidatus Dormibacteria bacterium]
MKLVTPRETRPGERRVALVPETVTRARSAGYEVAVQAGAGESSFISDAAYREAGASVEANLPGGDVMLRVRPPVAAEAGSVQEGSAAIGYLAPAGNGEALDALGTRRVTAFSVELLPRISRAQSMDVLSSQASLAGYQAVLMAASHAPRYFPMLMTAAGTIAPARVLVIGAGVAGLQAIATARRLGAVVQAYDVRAAARDEVRSLGATFLELELESAEGQGGYAREQTDEFLKRQRELIGQSVAASDVVVTTAAVPGRRAPLIVTAEMVRAMKPGSVVVDMASESGGNCELTRAGEVIDEGGVTIDGSTDLPSRMPVHASQLYARNVMNLLLLMTRDGSFVPDFDDEIVRATCVLRDGNRVGAAAPEPVPA